MKRVLFSTSGVMMVWACVLVVFPIAAVAIGGLCAAGGVFAFEELTRDA